MKALACLLLAGCVHVPAQITITSPDGVALATVDTQTGQVVLTEAAMRWVKR